MKKISNIIFYGLIVLFLYVQLTTIKAGHSWGGDFSQYIQHAKNLIELKPYHQGIMLDEWVNNPVGFPLMLAPWIKVFGVNFKVLKIINVLSWLFFVLFLRALAKKRLDDPLADLLSICLLTSPFFFTFKQNIISDVPFLSLLTCSLFLCHHFFTTKKHSFAFLCLLAISLSFTLLIRWAGLTLFASVILYLLINAYDKKYVVATMLILGLTIFVQSLAGINLGHHLQEGPQGWVAWSHQSYQLMSYNLNNFFIFFVPSFKGVVLSRGVTFLFTDIVTPIIFFGSILFLLLRMMKKKADILEYFLLVYLCALLIWPLQGGVRYVLPIVGVCLILMIQGVVVGLQKQDPKAWVVKGLCLLLIMSNGVHIYKNYSFNDDVIAQPDTQELIAWIKETTQPEDHFMFQRPRTLTLITDRKFAPFFIYSQDAAKWYQRIERFNIRYLLAFNSSVHKMLSSFPPDYIQLRQVWQNEKYVVLEVVEIKGRDVIPAEVGNSKK